MGYNKSYTNAMPVGAAKLPPMKWVCGNVGSYLQILFLKRQEAMLITRTRYYCSYILVFYSVYQECTINIWKMLYTFSVSKLYACSLISVPQCTNVSLCSSRTLVSRKSNYQKHATTTHETNRRNTSIIKIAIETSTYFFIWATKSGFELLSISTGVFYKTWIFSLQHRWQIWTALAMFYLTSGQGNFFSTEAWVVCLLEEQWISEVSVS